MTTITRESSKIKSFINGFLSDPAHDNQSLDSLLADVFRIALASLEAEPIGFRCRRNDNLGDWSYVYHREPDDFERKHLVIEGIYAAPPAPVVPEEATPENVEMLSGYVSTYKLTDSERDIAAEIWNACRAAMLQSGNFRENKDSSTNNFRETSETSTNSPVTPDGWVMVPKKLTAENGAKGVLSGEFSETTFISCPECFGDDDCDTCDGSGRIEIKVPVTWTTIKSIWDKGIAHFAAKPPQEVNRG
ncbi:DUF550 domain-containing protein [Escherichia coli]